MPDSLQASDYAKKNVPAGQRSKLWPHRTGIAELLAGNYSLRQIREWLAQNGVTVSVSALNEFVGRHLTADNRPAMPASSKPAIASPSPPPASSTIPPPSPTGSQVAAAKPADRVQQPQFKHNPVPDMDKLVGKKK